MDYDSQALFWDNERRANRAKIIADEISKRIGIKKTYKALEFGCGTGLISFCLRDKFKEITLIDTSRGMIDVLASKIRESGINNMKAYQVDIVDQQSLGEKYDVIYSSMALHHIKDTGEILAALISLLNENGYLCIVDLDEEDGSFHSCEKGFDGHNGFNQEKLAGIMTKLGLKEIESSSFYKGKKDIGDREVDYSLFIMICRK